MVKKRPSFNPTVVLYICIFLYYVYSFAIEYFPGTDFRYMPVRISSISSTNTALEFSAKEGGSTISMFDGSMETYWYGKVTEDDPNILEISLKSPTNIDRIVISSNSRFPVDLEVKCISVEGSSNTTVANNKSNELIIDIPETNCRNQKMFKITFFSTNDSDHLLRINDLTIQNKNSYYNLLMSNNIYLFELKKVLFLILVIIMGISIICQIRLVQQKKHETK